MTMPASVLATPDVTIPPLLATVGPAGGNGDINPIWIATSADGSHVVFRTREALTADDANARLDVYDWSEADGVRLVTAGSATEPTYEATRISDDGEHVFFYTPDPLLPADVDSDTDVYEWFQGQLTLVSTSPTDSGSNFNYPLGMTPDGATLYLSSSGRLAPEDTDDIVDIYERTGGIVSLLSVTATAGNGPHSVTFNGMSADGTHLFFQTEEQLDPSDADSVVDLYEWSAAGVALVSTSDTDTGANDAGYQASTADGSHVYFATGGRLSPEDTDFNSDTYERFQGTTRLVSTGPGGEEAGNFVRVQAASADGSQLFLEAAGRLTPDDTDNQNDLYLIGIGFATLLTPGDDGVGAFPLGMTPDGSRTIFSTIVSLVATDTDSARDIYMHTTAGTELVSTARGNPNLGLDAEFWAMSTDGLRVYFKSGEPLDANDTNADYDVAIWDDGEITRLPIPAGSDRLLEYNGTSTDGDRLFIRTGIRLASADTDSNRDIYQFTLTNLNPLTITPSPGAPASVGRLGRFEQQFRLNRTYGLAQHDPSVIDVTATFTAPSGATYDVPAFFGTDYRLRPGSGTVFGEAEQYDPVPETAGGVWHARFSPDETGTWDYTLRAQDHVPGQETTVISAPMTFQVTPSAARGQVVRDPRDDRFLRYADGTPYLPMGHNVAFGDGNPFLDGSHYYEPHFQSMQAAGQNWVRVWMTDFYITAIEWSSTHWSGQYGGVGQYGDVPAFRVEQILDLAEQYGLEVQLVLNDHGQFSSHVNARWAENPYNADNGGPVPADDPAAFFSDTTARQLFKQRLRYLVARYSAYRDILAWELFNETQFIGSAVKNPFNSAQVRDDLVAWHTEMAAYLRSLDPGDHLITTSSDIDTSAAAIWADPNIDLVQVHDYGPLSGRDERFRGYAEDLNATYGKPVIIGEFGLSGEPELNFDPTTSTLSADRIAHLSQATHLHNSAWASAMSASGAMSWWWGNYIRDDAAAHRTAPDFPANERINPPLRDFFAGEDLAGMALDTSTIAAPGSVVALGLDNGSSGFAWIRDVQNEYGTGAGPGDLAGRTMSGVRVEIAGFSDGTYRIEVHDPWGAQPIVDRLATSVGGSLSIALPDFTRDVAIKIRPVGAATAGQPVTVTISSPNGGPVDVTESTTPASPPAGSGYTYLAFQLGITAPPASTATPMTLVFTVDRALLESVDPDLTADTLSVFRNDVPVASCTAITTDAPATPDPCVSARETLVGGADAGDVRITVLSSAASRWNFGVGPARANQTITFGNLANRTMLQSPVTVTATASSGLTVSFSTTTPTVCTSGGTNGRTITLVGAGTCTVKADQAGNAAFNPAPSVSRGFTVSRVSQSITFNALPNRTMVQTPFTVAASASSGLAVTFASTTPSVCTTGGVTGSTVDLLSPGTCTIVASQAGNATYAPALDRTRSFTVSLARQVITFTSPGNKTLVQSPVTVSATSTSPLPVTFTTTTPAVCTSGGTNGATITLLAVGSCSVVASQPATSVYSAATPVTRTFTVSQATQTITFGPLPTRHILQSPVTVSASASSGLTVTFTTTSTSVCTAGGTNGATITLLKAGTCKVVASQTGNATYRAAQNVTQSFAVTTAKLAQTITFAPLGSRSIGAPPLTLTATASSGLPVSYAVAPASAAICSVSGSVVTLHDPGVCTITASQAGSPSYSAATPVTRSLTATLEGFVQASGTSLVLDGQPFQVFGAAIYHTSNYGHAADPDQIFGWAHDAHLNTLRLTDIFNQTTNDPNAPYAEADWQWIDSLIARSQDEGLKVILDLSSYRNWLVWSAEIDHGWVTNCQDNAPDRDEVDYAALDPYTVAHRADWTQFMTFVANRVNTVSGLTYRNDPTILVVSIAGEPIGPGYGICGRATTEQELTDFFEWSLAEWKSLDPHHLRSNGGLQGTYAGLDGNGDPIPSGQQVDGIAIFSLADNTLPSLHTYPPRTTQLPLADGQTPVLAPVAQDLGKPWFTEEFGFMQDDGDEFRASEFDFVFDEQTAYGSVGSLFWNLGPEIGVGTFDVNPSTPLTWARILAEAP